MLEQQMVIGIIDDVQGKEKFVIQSIQDNIKNFKRQCRMKNGFKRIVTVNLKELSAISLERKIGK